MTPDMPRACVYCRMYEPDHLPTCIEVIPRPSRDWPYADRQTSLTGDDVTDDGRLNYSTSTSTAALNRLALALTEAIDELDDDNDPDGDALGAFRDAQDALDDVLAVLRGR